MILQALLRRPRRVLGLGAGLLLLMGPGIARLGTDNSPDAFFVEDAAALARYDQFRERFGSDHLVRLVIAGESIWTPETLDWLARLEDQAAALPGVEAAGGFAGRYRAELLEWPPRDAGELRRRVLSDPLDRNTGWVSADGRTVSLLIQLQHQAPAAEEATLARLERLAAAGPPGLEGFPIGLPVLQRGMNEAFRTLATRHFPLLMLAAPLLLALVLRRWREVAVPLLFVGFCLAVTLGTMGYSGVRLNMVSVLVVPLVFVIALATAVHVLLCFRFHARRRRSASRVVRVTYGEKAWPVFWTGATTLLAFGSLATSPVPPVKSLGLWTACGLAVVIFGAFTVLPALLEVQPRQRAGEAGGFEVHGRRWGGDGAAWAVRHRGRVLLAALALALLAAAGLPRLELGTSLKSYFPPAHSLSRALARVEAAGLGEVSAELVLERRQGGGTEEDGGFREPAALARLSALTADLRREPLIAGAVGAGDLLEAMIASVVVDGEVDDDLRWLVLGLTESDPRSRRVLEGLLARGGGSARINLSLPLAGFDTLQPVFERAKQRAHAYFPRAEVFVTGQFPLVLESQRRLLKTLLTSFSFTLAVVTAVFLLLLRRPGAVLRALVPNLWPVLLILGAMGWAGIPVDSTTVIVAAVVLGLAVDDTLHSLARFRRLGPGLGAPEALRWTLERIAPAHLLTTLLLVVGFGVCALSEFIPVARFGALTSAALIVALAGDLYLLPALLGSPQKRSV